MGHTSIAIAACVMALAACGGPQGGSTPKPPPPDVTDAPVSEVPDAGPSTATAEPGAALTAENCEALLKHMSRLMYEEQVRTKPEPERPTQEDLQIATDQLRGEMMQHCVGAEPALFAYDCAMAAQDFQAMGACMGQSKGT